MLPVSRGVSLLLLCVLVGIPLVARAQMSSDSYQIPWDTLSSAGDEQGRSASYDIYDTVGSAIAGEGSSASYQALAGYRAGDERSLGFEVATQDLSAASGVAYDAFSAATRTVSTASASGASGFSVGDLVALVENPGASQITAVGKVISKTGSSITLDRVDGQGSSLSASPSANTAYIYSLTGSAFTFGTVSAASVSVGVGALEAISDAGAGYTVYAQASGQPTNGSHSLAAVSDGSVTAGSEEYGVRVYGSTAAHAFDIGVTSTAYSIQLSSQRAASPADRVALLYKLAISGTTPSGTYSQSMFFTLTPNY